MMEEDPTYNPYSIHSKYPIIHTTNMEDCSSLDCTMDEEAVQGSWAAAVADSNSSTHGSNSSVDSNRGRFANLSRRVNSSSLVKKGLFYGGVFVALASVGLAGVKVGMVLHEGGYFAKSIDEFTAVSGAVEEQQVERSSDDDLVGECVHSFEYSSW
jgi:hypothetical protein